MEKDDNETLTTNHPNGAVDKIRDLLFGSQLATYEQNFERLETMIVGDVKQSMNEINSRLNRVEISLNQRIDRTQQAFENEKKQQLQIINSISQTQAQNFQQLNDQIQQIKSLSSSERAQIKASLEQHDQNMGTQIQRLREQFDQSLTDQVKRLEAQIVNRDKLAELFSELSAQLNND